MKKALMIYNPYSGGRGILHQLDFILKTPKNIMFASFPIELVQIMMLVF